MKDRNNKLLMEKIMRLKKEKSIYIIAHYYQREEVQDVADFVGDSYAMAVQAKKSPCDTIIVAGVDFMAQTAAILCPDKIVLSPEPRATCPMANSITINDILAYKEKYPDGMVVSYVNTPAEIKAVSDICCTSSNAAKIIKRLPPDTRIFFVPDQNLGRNVGSKLDRAMDLFSSQCPTHAKVKREDLLKLKKVYPKAKVMVHPECDPDVVDIADYVGSTAGMVKYVKETDAPTFIVGTECGIFHPILTNNPDKELILASEELVCPNMKSITLDKVLYSIENMETLITVPEDIRAKAAQALEKMIEYAQ
jgi:quinolinate synthase